MIPAERTPDPRPGDARGRDASDRDTTSQDTADQGTASQAPLSQGSPSQDPLSRDTAGLLFAAEMYGVQLDHLAVVLGVSPARARAIAATWRDRGYADSARLGPGAPWTWVTRAGLTACGLRYTAAPPALGRLAHIRAVAAVRLALESAPHYAAAGGYWRSERRLRARMGGRVGLREHIPDGEVHWPDDAPVAWAGECWAIEVELTAKTAPRTAAIMRELLTKTGDYGGPAARTWPVSAQGAPAQGAPAQGAPVQRAPTQGAPTQGAQPPRHARVIYLCAPAARPTVARAREALGQPGARIEIRLLPPGAALPTPAPARPVGHSGLTRNR